MKGATMTGEKLKEWRSAEKLTQAELAYRIGVTVTTVSAWEQNRSPIPKYLELLIKEWGKK